MDASILDRGARLGATSVSLLWSVSITSVVDDDSEKLMSDINLLRADGGCLGIWSRRRTYESAISLGELITEL